MRFTPILSILAVQAASPADTVVTKVITEHGMLDWTNGVLALVVLLIGSVALITLVMLLLTLRKSVIRSSALIEQFVADSKPLMASVTNVAQDAREVVAMLRTDVERVTDAAGVISDQLLDMADAAAARVDELHAVVDVLQNELEDTAIGAIATVRGVRAGARTLVHRRRPEPDDAPDQV